MSHSESYWKRREEADEEREAPPSVESAEGAQVSAPERIEGSAWMDSEEADAPGPMFGPVEPPPPVPPDVAPPPPGPPAPDDFEPMPDPKVALAKALNPREQSRSDMQAIMARKYTPSAALGDADIVKARTERRSQVNRDDFTRALQSALLRKPFSPTAPDDVAGDLSQRRAREEAGFERQRSNDLSATSMLARALKGGEGMTPYQVEQLKRNDVLDEQRRINRSEDVKYREQAHADSVETQRMGHQIMGRMAATKEASEARQERKEEKAETQDLPPGHEVAPGANPSPDSRKKYTALVASQQKMKELTAAMRAELQGAGVLDRMLPGEKKRRLQQLATQLKIEGKNVAELGALSGPDMSLMDAMATDPTSVSSLFGGNLDSNLAGMDTWADSAVRAGSKTYGIRPTGGGSEQAPRAVVPISEEPPEGAIPPNAKNVRKHGKGWAYTLPDGSDEYVGPP